VDRGQQALLQRVKKIGAQTLVLLPPYVVAATVLIFII
jgi:dihydrodipicolinate synthase/N-acetylneuraminate lyase